MAVTESSTKVVLGGARGGPEDTTLREDRWWLQPLVIVSVLSAFVIYSTWAAFQNKNYYVGASLHRDLISPFYSPCIGGLVRARRVAPGLASAGSDLSPALLILIFPLGFRLTCYYYRRSYYRAFWWSPAGVRGRRRATASTRGETRFPLVMQNLHRYFFYAGLVFNVVLTIRRGRWPSASPASAGASRVGHDRAVRQRRACCGCTRSAATPVATCAAATSRASRRHPLRYRFWKMLTPLNAKHMNFAWASLLFVGFTDVYVRLVASGALTDYKLF